MLVSMESNRASAKKVGLYSFYQKNQENNHKENKSGKKCRNITRADLFAVNTPALQVM